MPLILMVETTDPSLRAHAGKRIEVARSLTVGRGAENDLVLPDPGRVLSKNHCVLSFDGSGYVITDRSTNGVFMNHSPDRLERGVPTPLRQDDYLQLGDFGLVILEASGLEASGSGGGQAAGGAAPDAFDDLLGDMARHPAPNRPAVPNAGPDPFDALFDDPPAKPPSALPQSAYGSPIDPSGPLDLGFDSAPSSGGDSLFGGPPGNAGPLSGGGGGMMIPDDDDLFGPKPVRNNWQGGSRADHAASEAGFFAPPKISTEAIPDDWDPAADLGLPAPPRQVPAAPPPVQSASPAPSPFEEAPPPRPAPIPVASIPPVAAPEVAAPAVPSAVAPPAAIVAATPGSGAPLAAFLKETGLDQAAISDAQAVQMMAMLGRTMRLLVAGLTEILAARASTKQEFRIERTMIGKLDNNPLKFGATPDEAMGVLMLQNVPGFLSAEQAMGQALQDIKSHQLAVMAGMQTALTTLIARFDPAQLEKRIEKSSLIEGVLPGARKARYWDLFRKLYGDIARELEDDLQSLFGAEFAAAYRAQIEKLQEGRETE